MFGSKEIKCLFKSKSKDPSFMFNPIIGLIQQLEFTTGHLLDHQSTLHQTKDKYIFIILH